MSSIQRAYIAGFLDADGSIYVKLTKNITYKYQYQVAPYIVFYQSQQSKKSLQEIQKMTGVGYIRKRNDGIEEYIIGDINSIREFLRVVSKFLIYKENQAKLMLEILNLKEKVKSSLDFLALCRLIDQFQQLNYSKKRIILAETVEITLKEKGFLTP